MAPELKRFSTIAFHLAALAPKCACPTARAGFVARPLHFIAGGYVCVQDMIGAPYNPPMRPRDLLLAGLDSLRRQKLRTTLTTLGVTIGIATLVASVAVGVGVRRIIEDGFKREHRLREITVYPGFDRGGDEFAGVPEDALRVEGDMAPERRGRIRKRLARDWRNQHTAPAPRPLTPVRMRELASWDHVAGVEPDLRESARLMFAGQVIHGNVSGFDGDPAKLGAVVEFGRPPAGGADE